MAAGGSSVRCFQGLLIFGNVIIGLCGLALTAECIFFVSDQQGLYPLLHADNNDDIYAAAWIGIFTGFSFFLLSIMGIIGIMNSNRRLLMAYLILMFVVYCFEAGSAITAATQRDFFVKELFLRQMLDRYQNNAYSANDDELTKSKGVTKVWDNLMLQKNCCGVNGPKDWQDYNSTFRTLNTDLAFPWPTKCCVMGPPGVPKDLNACRVGLQGYLKTTGCYDVISGFMNHHSWGVAWSGFAILCWTFWVLLGTMFYWTRIEY